MKRVIGHSRADEVTDRKLPKSSQDRLGLFLSKWRNHRVMRDVDAPFLDIACGDNRLVRSTEGGIGIDIMNYGQADVVVADFRDLPFRRESFATITIVASLNYFDDPRAVLRGCVELLRADASIVLTLLDPALGKLWHAMREPWAKAPGISKKELQRLIDGLDLSLVKHSRFMLGINNLYVLRKSKSSNKLERFLPASATQEKIQDCPNV